MHIQVVSNHSDALTDCFQWKELVQWQIWSSFCWGITLHFNMIPRLGPIISWLITHWTIPWDSKTHCFDDIFAVTASWFNWGIRSHRDHCFNGGVMIHELSTAHDCRPPLWFTDWRNQVVTYPASWLLGWLQLGTLGVWTRFIGIHWGALFWWNWSSMISTYSSGLPTS